MIEFNFVKQNSITINYSYTFPKRIVTTVVGFNSQWLNTTRLVFLKIMRNVLCYLVNTL